MTTTFPSPVMIRLPVASRPMVTCFWSPIAMILCKNPLSIGLERKLYGGQKLMPGRAQPSRRIHQMRLQRRQLFGKPTRGLSPDERPLERGADLRFVRLGLARLLLRVIDRASDFLLIRR